MFAELCFAFLQAKRSLHARAEPLMKHLLACKKAKQRLDACCCHCKRSTCPLKALPGRRLSSRKKAPKYCFAFLLVVALAK